MSDLLRKGLLFSLLMVVVCSCTHETPVVEPKSKKASQRIVSHMPSLTEIIYALGAGDRVVGVSDFCTYPEDAKKKPKVGGLMNASMEAVIDLQPDLILMSVNQQEQAKKYQQLGFSVMSVKTENFQGVLESIGKIGKRLKLEKQAAQLKRRMVSEMDAIRARTKGKPRVKTLLVIGHESGSLRDIWASAKGSFHDELLTIAGGENILGDSMAAYPKISKEEILQASPEAVIVIYSHAVNKEERQKEIALWEPLGYIEAYKRKRICVVGAEWAHKAGPRMGKIAEAFYDCLHENNKEPR